MTQEHPITPPPGLVQQWLGEFFGCTVSGELNNFQHYFATQAARWGADQELEACFSWVSQFDYDDYSYGDRLRAARRGRSRPPSLKEQALALIDECTDPHGDYLDDNALATIRRALESLPS